jgi:hypothetical protein
MQQAVDQLCRDTQPRPLQAYWLARPGRRHPATQAHLMCMLWPSCSSALNRCVRVSAAPQPYACRCFHRRLRGAASSRSKPARNVCCQAASVVRPSAASAARTRATPRAPTSALHSLSVRPRQIACGVAAAAPGLSHSSAASAAGARRRQRRQPHAPLAPCAAQTCRQTWPCGTTC